MKIVCTIKRKLGTHTKMPDDGTVYSFVPNAHGDHVAEVENPAHIKRLLAIDVYLPYEEPGAASAAPQPSQDSDAGDDDGEPAPDVTAFPADLTAMTFEELQAEYHHRFGRAAPKQIKYETLVARLAEAREDAAKKE